MKYAIIVPDGAADEPLAELGNRTPLQAANIPHMDEIARVGRLGLVRTIPKGMYPGSDVANLSVLGYDPAQYYTGRGPIEAASMGVTLQPGQFTFRCNLVTVANGKMEDYSAGHITSKESAALIESLNKTLGSERVKLLPGVSYRHILLFTGAGDFDVTCVAAHDIVGEPIKNHLPKGKGADQLNYLMERSREVLAEHDVNRVRVDLEQNPATMIWPFWGGGPLPSIPKFKDRFGQRAALISAVDLLNGLAVVLGMQRITVPGATGFIDTDYAAKGRYAIEALKEFDLVLVHVEAPDEAGHTGEALQKVKALEQIDRHVVGPVHEALRGCGEYRILVLPDHPTPLAFRKHTPEPVPFAMCGTRVISPRELPFTEQDAEASDLKIERGHELMEYFLTSNL